MSDTPISDDRLAYLRAMARWAASNGTDMHIDPDDFLALIWRLEAAERGPRGDTRLPVDADEYFGKPLAVLTPDPEKP